MLALFWGGFYLAFNSGGFRQDVYESNAVNWAGGGTVVAAPPDPKVIGKRLYTQNCIVCHQANGMGVAGQFPRSWKVSGCFRREPTRTTTLSS